LKASANPKFFANLPTVEEAWATFMAALGTVQLPSERVPLRDALGRVLAEDLPSPCDVPSYNKAAMDGFAARAEDIAAASPQRAVKLKVKGEILAGDIAPRSVEKGEAWQVATGAPVPKGADVVVILEEAKKTANGMVEVYARPERWKNILRIGEDIRRGEVLFKQGLTLKPQDLGVLASLGFSEVDVIRRVRVAVASSGDELVEVGETRCEGKTFDINRVILTSMARELGCATVDLGIARDNRESIAATLKRGLAEADVVLISAGSSVGERDLVPSVVQALGKPGLLVHGVRMRPAYPTGLAVVDGKPIISLPGYPLSAVIAFNVFARPLLLKMMNASEEPPRRLRARLLQDVTARPGYRTFARVVVRKTSSDYEAELIKTSGAGILSSLVRANAWLIIPEDRRGYSAGEEVEVTLIRPLDGESR